MFAKSTIAPAPSGELLDVLDLAHEALVACLRETGAMAQRDETARQQAITKTRSFDLIDELEEGSRELDVDSGGFDIQKAALGREMDDAFAECRGHVAKELDAAIVTSDALATFVKVEVARLHAYDRLARIQTEELCSLTPPRS